MDFYEPIIGEQLTQAEPEKQEHNTTDEAVHKLEDEIEKIYGNVEDRFKDIWKTASTNANTLQEAYKLDEHKEKLLSQLKQAKENVNNKAKFSENIAQIEEQLKKVNVKDVSLDSLKANAVSALDSLDATLEKVELQAGKYVSSFTSFFSNIVSVDSATPQEAETLFKSPLASHENYGTSRYESELFKLHTDPSFYLSKDPSEEKAIADFNADSETDEISHLLEKFPHTLTKLMNELVPVKVSYNEFWFKYFQHEKKLKESEQKRKQLLQRKIDSKTDSAKDGDEDDDFTWDDDEDEDNIVDLGKEDPSPPTSSKKPPSDDEDDDWE